MYSYIVHVSTLKCLCFYDTYACILCIYSYIIAKLHYVVVKNVIGSSLMQPMTVCSADVPKEIIETSSSTRHLLWLSPAVVLSSPGSSWWTLCLWMCVCACVHVRVSMCVCVHEPTEHMRFNQTFRSDSIRPIAATACSSFLVYAVEHQYLVHGGVACRVLYEIHLLSYLTHHLSGKVSYHTHHLSGKVSVDPV